MSLNVGRRGRLYVVQEAGSLGGNGAGYGQVQDGASASNTLSAAARALRHVDFRFAYDPFDRVNSDEKKTSPGQVATFDRRAKATLNSLVALLRPSGTLNTTPECDPVLLAAFGAKTNVTLSTTIASGAAIGGCTLTSGAGLAVGDVLQIVVSAKLYARFITAVDTGTGVVTWAPNLPSAPAGGAVVKAGITYKLTTDLAISLAMLHCLPGFRRECRGIGLDKFSLAMDANLDPRFTVSGPAQKQLNDATAVADPATFTTVGGNPPSGIIGECYIANVLYLMKKASVEITNSLSVRNEEVGANTDSGEASEVYRSGRRSVDVALDAFVETAATLHDFAVAGTTKSFFKQNGRTNGNIVAVYCPKVYWRPPETDSPEGPSNWSFKGTALESADSMNDEAILGIV